MNVQESGYSARALFPPQLSSIPTVAALISMNAPTLRCATRLNSHAFRPETFVKSRYKAIPVAHREPNQASRERLISRGPSQPASRIAL